MLDMIWVELFKLRKRRMTWILVAILAAFFCMYFLVMNYFIKHLPPGMGAHSIKEVQSLLTFPDAFKFIFIIANSIGSILIMILVASAVGNEYGWNTGRLLLTRKGNRNQFLISKLLAYIIIAIIGIVISLIIGFILAIYTTNSINGSISWNFVNASLIGDIFRMFGWTLYSLFVYILLAFFASILGRSALVGIGVGLGYYFVESIASFILNLAGGSLDNIPPYLLGTNVQAILPQIQMGGPFASTGTVPSTLHASITLAIYSIIFLGVSFYLFRKKDITS
ncbi:MAG: ABC transporter permease subunit [Chloroflexi bacterium]|nr:ABC transporter permease subunit [Chloroflexota bacterium]